MGKARAPSFPGTMEGIAARFAAQVKLGEPFAPGRTYRASSVFVDRETIYSWGKHWPIARMIIRGGRAVRVLFNPETCSDGTSRARNAVRRALVEAGLGYLIVETPKADMWRETPEA